MYRGWSLNLPVKLIIVECVCVDECVCYFAEKQREEQRQQKLSEKRGRREESPERYYWAERSGVTNRPDEGHRHPPQPAAQEPHGAMRWDDSSTQGQMELAMAEFNRHSAPPLKGQELTTAPTQNAYNGEGNRYAVILFGGDVLD